MSITAYFGFPGSGKSHECVKSVILPAYMKGRRIVTNIDGINPDAIRDYALKLSKGKGENFGEIVSVTDDQVMKSGFFPYKLSDEEGYSRNDTFCKAGDLICLDEVWRFWSSDKQMTLEHLSFIAEHRHFTDPDSGLSCDLVLVNQSPDTIARRIKPLIETSYKMTKLVMIGAKSRYRVDVYNGVRFTKSSRTTYYQNKYDKNIFKLYNSYNGGKGNEATVDSRQNVFSQTKLWVFLFGYLFLFIGCGYLIYQYFNPNVDNSSVLGGSGGNSDMDALHLQSDGGNVGNNLLSGDRNQGTQEASREQISLSSKWRISGFLSVDNYNYVTLVNSSGNIRLVNKTEFHGKGIMMFGFVDGEKVTYFSGVSK
ncbi:zonular occludens toxin domain-containing protein [Xenorhabdus innexi]|uniref:Zona occludens toxin n=1 Tax=Xenorhabdus innexi TaxID=290109 RepID=A0A1N6MY19_9GAMM|nr:zonular occludens toxin domain-containing protein [Xenorhabdus innexi]PHM31186.1 zona occludens toxin [Xenorhabdus innexi]SIP73677.1 Zonula occludens toxin [Xenorhabdus innexi]